MGVLAVWFTRYEMCAFIEVNFLNLGKRRVRDGGPSQSVRMPMRYSGTKTESSAPTPTTSQKRQLYNVQRLLFKHSCLSQLLLPNNEILYFLIVWAISYSQVKVY